MKYGDRLKKARTYAGLTQAGLADAIGGACSQENISKLERGNATGSEFTPLFADACGINHFWLATGKEEMLSRDGASTISHRATMGASTATASYSVTKQDFEFIRRVNELPIECRKTLEVVLAEQERLLKPAPRAPRKFVKIEYATDTRISGAGNRLTLNDKKHANKR